MQDPDIAVPQRAGPLPPVARLLGFLSEREHRNVIDWVLANPGVFGAATVTKGQSSTESHVDPGRRVCATSRVIGPHEPMLRERLLGALPALMTQVGTRLSADSLELEFAAHGDGAFFAPHTDILVGAKRQSAGDKPGRDRMLSAVYYFYAEPKAFSGGDLNLYRFGADPSISGQGESDRITIEPINNSLVAFPSWAKHEVTRVSCPSGLFEDRRFALNCWYCQAR